MEWLGHLQLCLEHIKSFDRLKKSDQPISFAASHPYPTNPCFKIRRTEMAGSSNLVSETGVVRTHQLGNTLEIVDFI